MNTTFTRSVIGLLAILAAAGSIDNSGARSRVT